MGGMPDPLHILCALSRTLAIADLLREIKRSSTNWIKDNAPELRKFFWQGGYGVFSISAGNADAVKRYIQNQADHRRTESFQDELRRVFHEHGIAFDERYVWD
ncbi:MAG: IS200/IS605 family transposase [Planctomycetota bacterium]